MNRRRGTRAHAAITIAYYIGLGAGVVIASNVPGWVQVAALAGMVVALFLAHALVDSDRP